MTQILNWVMTEKGHDPDRPDHDPDQSKKLGHDPSSSHDRIPKNI